MKTDDDKFMDRIRHMTIPELCDESHKLRHAQKRLKRRMEAISQRITQVSDRQADHYRQHRSRAGNQL